MPVAPPPPFRVDLSFEDGHGFVAPHGELDMGTVGEVREGLHAVVERGVACVVLDLGGLTFMDSTGITLLVQCRAAAAANGHRFAIMDGGAAVMRALDITGLTDHFDRYGT